MSRFSEKFRLDHALKDPEVFSRNDRATATEIGRMIARTRVIERTTHILTASDFNEVFEELLKPVPGTTDEFSDAEELRTHWRQLCHDTERADFLFDLAGKKLDYLRTGCKKMNGHLLAKRSDLYMRKRRGTTAS
ncbi:MAG: hypothetical protein PHO20_02925 [Candidatus Peribacteraceae bacterium]|nr:hypothetical protein [Candidatus Peribacteraceae bacterium]MDD5739694.1 hypothetical protein [Candidatus Peribacteraceae bacterium]